MNRRKFFERLVYIETDIPNYESNSALSVADPTQAMSIGQFIKCSQLGLKVPQYSEISMQFNGLSVDDVGILERTSTDKFEVAIEERKRHRQVGNEFNKVKQSKKQKKNDN